MQDGDEVTLATTSGDAWWSARIPGGREDLLAVAGAPPGRDLEASTASDYMSDYEAFWIAHGGGNAAGRGDTSRASIKRWTDNHGSASSAIRVLETCSEKAARSRPRGRAGDTRTTATLETVRRALATALAPVRGRKSLLLFSRGFIEDYRSRNARSSGGVARDQHRRLSSSMRAGCSRA